MAVHFMCKVLVLEQNIVRRFYLENLDQNLCDSFCGYFFTHKTGEDKLPLCA